MQTLKPGTRCQNRNGLFGYRTGPLPFPSCGADAVRLVTVQSASVARSQNYRPNVQIDVPMCEACARFHEEGARREA